MSSALADLARRVIDANKYMTLATADPDGRPWATPVYFSPDRYRDFYWVSSPDAQHSRNVAARPDISIVVFDSQVPIGGGEAVYMSAHAALVPDDELAERCAIFSRRSFPGLRSFGPEDVRPPGLIRLYRATVTEHSVLVSAWNPINDRGIDYRMTVTL